MTTITKAGAKAAIRDHLTGTYGAWLSSSIPNGTDYYRLQPSPSGSPGLELVVGVNVRGPVTTFVTVERMNSMWLPGYPREWLEANVEPFGWRWINHTRGASPVVSGGWGDSTFVLTHEAVDLLALWIPQEITWAAEEARKFLASHVDH